MRPRTRGDCANVPRPCPFVGCVHNLYLEVRPRSGNLKFPHGELEPDEVPPHESCALDIAEREHPPTIEEVGRVLGITREWARQTFNEALLKVEVHGGQVLPELLAGR